MSISAELTSQVHSWIEQDPDAATRAELSELLASDDLASIAELEDAFRAPLEFGTAGLRGKLGGGPNRMNRVVVIQAAAGLAEYLASQGLQGQSVVIGYDGRFNSDVFATDTARVMAAAGFKPFIFDHMVPTPVLAFAIRDLGTCAGVMVTASHNPPQDNGYKVYLGDGRQIVSPADTEISACIRKVADVREVPMSDECEIVGADVEERYIASLASVIHSGPTTPQQRGDIVSVYTAMHGVGWNSVHEACISSDFKEPNAVPEQRDPDPLFPTVAFPNPEEKGALDLSIAMANKTSADILIANDPDADRLAVALPLAGGQWKTLHGDQVGSLLAWWVIERARRTGVTLHGTFANSVVSSMLMESIAHAAGLTYENTLTGFKWVSRVPNLIYGYEEALGYCVNPEFVGDKDGVSAATFILEMAAALKDEGRTLWDVLDDLALEHGLHVSDQVSVRVSDLSQVTHVMSHLRNSPPTAIGGLKVEQVLDLAKSDTGLPPTDGVIFMLKATDEVSKARVIVRPSGTEPKIKCYLEVVCPNKDLDVARTVATATLEALVADAKPLLS